MWKWKKNRLEQYEETLTFLEEQKETVWLINELIAYHRTLLQERIFLLKGPIVAMIRFYEEDTKNQLSFLKEKKEKESIAKNEERIAANNLAIKELEQLRPIADQIAYYERLKTSLERKLSKEEIEEIKRKVMKTEGMTR